MSSRTRKKMGRPLAYTPSLAEEICIRIAGGESLRKICKSEGMPAFQTVLRWAFHADQEEVGNFHEQYARARELQAELRADEIVEISDNTKDAAKARVRIDARKWVASKLLPKRYGNRVALDHTGFNPVLNVILEGDPVQHVFDEESEQGDGAE